MALKEIEYAVGLYGIKPAYRLDGGVQGDHEVTRLKFTIEDALHAKLIEMAGATSGKLYYRFDRFNGEGGYDPTVEQELASNVIVYPIDEWLTRYGGIIKVTLVISVEREDETVSELYHFTAVLSLRSRPTLQHSNGYVYKSLNSMSASAKLAAESAELAALKAEEAEENAANSAIDCKNYAEELNGAEVIFQSDLDDEGQPLDFDFRIDGSLSSTSENPVQNKAIKQEFAKMSKYIKEQLEVYKNAILLDAHPVGSYYWSNVNENPEKLFGGVWKQVKDTFVIAAGDTYKVGAADLKAMDEIKAESGTETVTLSEANLPGLLCGAGVPNEFLTGTDDAGDPKYSYKMQRHRVNLDVGTGDYYIFAGKGLGEKTASADDANLKWYEGNSEAFSIMPPYRVAYCWIRIA